MVLKISQKKEAAIAAASDAKTYKAGRIVNPFNGDGQIVAFDWL